MECRGDTENVTEEFCYNEVMGEIKFEIDIFDHEPPHFHFNGQVGNVTIAYDGTSH
jgi:hypothetical protein